MKNGRDRLVCSVCVRIDDQQEKSKQVNTSQYVDVIVFSPC